MLFSAFDPSSIFDWIQSGGIIGLLIVILLGGARRWWVFGWQYKELLQRYEKVEQSNEMWMQIAVRGVNVTEKIVGTVTNEPSKA